ncbi:MAG TPA: DUF3995 domain-containing protein [Nocardioidaceae bacterium]|nr:DUF3995 domain-containing protein [Nocardioidaceae bacterium]
MPKTSTATVLLGAAACVGLVHAGFSLYWALGGRRLLPTVGEWAVVYAREAPLSAALLLLVVTAVKAVLALTPFLVVRKGQALPRSWRLLGWLSAVVLVGYGAANTVTAWLVLGGALRPEGGYDRPAMVGHAYLWDPLFLVWGLLLGAGLWVSRPSVQPRPARRR